MNDNSLAFAEYWRNSLADAEQSYGALKQSDINQLLCCSKEELKIGRIRKNFVDICFKEEDEHAQTVEVLLRPKVYRVLREHNQKNHVATIPNVVTPIISAALLARDGRLFPLVDHTTIARDILEPLDRGAFSIGLLSDLDSALSKKTFSGIIYSADKNETLSDDDFLTQWNAYLASCDALLTEITHDCLDTGQTHVQADEFYLMKKLSVVGASKNILSLYDNIRKNNPDTLLFDRYACSISEPEEPCFPSQLTFAERLGHSSDLYPLAKAQRDALSHFMRSEIGDILAVNGPPGTGKTTLLLSVVASLWAKAALAGGDPPVILAASTNNQAVTNIITAFGKDFSTGQGRFSGRWLPEIKSFGAYFPSKTKEKEQSNLYQTQAFFDDIESAEYIESAKIYFLERASHAFNTSNITLEDTLTALQNNIRTKSHELEALEQAWEVLCQARLQRQAILGDNHPENALDKLKQHTQHLEDQSISGNAVLDHWEAYLAHESIFFSLFAWLAPIARKRLLKAKVFLKTQSVGETFFQSEWTNLEQIHSSLKEQSADLTRAYNAQQIRYQHAQNIFQAEQSALLSWAKALQPLGKADEAKQISLDDCDAFADTTIRFNIFLLCTHYWEGRWLLEMQELLPDLDKEKRKNGAVAVKKRWLRYMMLTPCIVSTFYMLPDKMKVQKYENGGTYSDDYLYDFADLLIVDEAGQVLPEVAGASFALAKKALVIGDTLQIEPIWSIPPPVDIGNMASAGLLDKRNDREHYEYIADMGKTAASGTVMRIAQCASRYHYDPDLARGMFLYEHRRCYNEIINYCNELCYHNKLIPMRGSIPNSTNSSNLPAMGYLHIDGICQANRSGSRYNLFEAETIAAWLVANKECLENSYQQTLSQIVAIVTPFGGQVAAVSKACQNKNIAVGGKDGMTIGTVHSLQGAERPVIIFSAVYSKHADGGFIDKSLSMLNVAVSRAKDSFLVFGDMDVFETAVKSTPRGILANYIFKEPSNELQFDYQPRPDLVEKTSVTHLRDAQQHDQFLLTTLNHDVMREIHIVTPWIRLERIIEIGAMEAMSNAVQRGVKVLVYTDSEFNDDLHIPPARKALNAQGVELLVVRKVHSKVIIGDDHLYCVGSFNWFSAHRSGQYARHETSLVYSGPDIIGEIDFTKQSLRQRIIS